MVLSHPNKMETTRFLCHITIVNRDFGRITFAVMHRSFKTFSVSAIQPYAPLEEQYISPITLYRIDGEWSYDATSANDTVSDSLLSAVVNELDKKLINISAHNS